MALLPPPLWPLGTEQPVIPTPPPKEIREIKEKENPFPTPNQLTKQAPPSQKTRLWGEAISAEPCAPLHGARPEAWLPLLATPQVCSPSGLSPGMSFLSKAKSPKCVSAERKGLGQERAVQAGSGWQPQPAPPGYEASGRHALHPVGALFLVRCV